ncbi:hypothetical protein AMS68_006180 [Peltaster fructicola]|uniref:Transcription factor domain-containing protein n=1 Tax=Peltaster fructicola TaxID=286661 RepID=A0A6H0Y0X5_9PEZI|nr:hypothetical protein AMS68_006180 [Peltaster fructicola]
MPAPPAETAATSPSQGPQPLKPASPKNLTSIAEDKPTSTPTVDGPRPFLDMPSTGPSPQGTSPPLINTFVPPHPPFANPEDLVSGSSSDASSPQFMLDWSQVQMPLGFDGLVQPNMIMHSDLPFDPNGMPGMPPSADGMLNMMPPLGGDMAPLITPIETPTIERGFSEMELAQGAMYNPERHLSVSAHSDRHDMSAIIAAQDGWSVFRCTPIAPSSACPKTARLNLEKLEQSLKNHKGWSTWSPQWEEADFGGGDHLTVMQLHESTRDKLLAITQSFLHKALDIHREGTTHHSPASGQLTPMSNGSLNFVILPPARVLEYFLRSHANGFERYFPLTSRGILDANELMHCYNDRASSLLVLMMIAQGAVNIPDSESRWLTGGLTEACRISLFDLIEKNIIMAGDPVVLHAALLFTVLAAWSGDKWQMDIAMGQRGMYFAMLRHSAILDYRPMPPPSPEQRVHTEQLWREWTQNESRSRLVYSWAMVDQDLALFHDTAPLFSVTEFAVPMPDTDRLWQAKSAGEWSSIFEQVHEFSGGFSSVGSGARPLSLRDLFRHFLDDEMISLGIEMTPMQLRLLLHPLQGMVCQFSQLLSCFSDPLSSRNKGTRAITATSTRSRLEEVQSLLQRWFDLAERYLKANPMCAMMQTNLVLFHLISLNAVTNFPRSSALPGRCITDVEEAVFHCGQALRLVRSMPRGIRPPWWAGAIYRVGLVLWTDSLMRKPVQTLTPPGNGMLPVPGPSFAIDALLPDHPLIVRYLTKREGVPCVSKRDGSQLPIDQPFQILQHCVATIEEGAATRLSDGIKMKLERLAKG